MQCLLKHSKQRYVVSSNLGILLKYNARKYGIINVASSNIKLDSEITRLCFPLSFGLYTKVFQELGGLQSLVLNNGFFKTSSSKLYSTRNFSTNTTNKRSSKDSKESPKDPDNDMPNNDMNDMNKQYAFYMKLQIVMYTFLVIYTALFADPNKNIEQTLRVVSWSDFINELLLKGQVSAIYIYPNGMRAILRTGTMFKGRLYHGFLRSIDVYGIPDLKTIEPKIRFIEQRIGIRMEDGIPIIYKRFEAETQLLWLLSLFSFIYMIRLISPAVKFKIPNIRDANYTLVEPFSGKGVRFKDVAGLKEAKVEVMEFVDYLKNPEHYKRLGAKVPKGALLLGPPGCGKTLLAKAVATESNVPFLSMNGSEFIELVGGVGAARVRSLFADAKQRAPSIIYIDEIDAIGRNRVQGPTRFSNSEFDHTLNQLLVEMDGMTTSEDIIVLASTNRAEVLDNALLRRGRFDRHILIDLPTLHERNEIFEYYLNRLSLEGEPSQYSRCLAHLSTGFSGADIAHVCNEGALHAVSVGKTKVDNSDLMYAIDKVLGGTAKKTSSITPSEKKVVGYHEAGHALSAWLLEHINPLVKVTIVPRTNKKLSFTIFSDTNLHIRSSEYLFQNICVLLGGRVAENIMFNKFSSQAQSDLKKATQLAYRQVQQFGMSPKIGLISFDERHTAPNVKKPYSKKLANLMDLEVRRLITEAYKSTEKLLLNNKDKLIILAEALLKKETLSYKDIEALIGPPPFGKKNVSEMEELRF